MKKIICTLIFIFCFGFTVQARELAAKENVSPNKIWTVTFTSDFDKNSLDQVKVVDNYGNNIKVEKKIVDGRTITVEPVDGAWGRGVVYTLQTNNIKSAKGKVIKSPATMNFTTGGIGFTPSGDYKEDKKYLYEHMSKILWSDENIKRQVNCYSVDVFNGNNGGIIVSFDTDTWSTQQIISSPTSALAIQNQIDSTYNYMKVKYPNKNIQVGLFYHEFFNKKIDGYTLINYDTVTNKYEMMFTLGTRDASGGHYINGGN